MESDSLRHALQELETAAAGLLVPSETDRPFVTYTYSLRRGQLPAPAAVLRNLNRGPDEPVEMTSVDDFFNPLVPAAGTDDAARARWQNLVETLRALLDPIEVFRVGTTEIDVLILGVVEGGGVIGLRTTVVETLKKSAMVRSPEVQYQVFVDIEDAPDAFSHKLEERSHKRPTGNVVLSADPFGFSYKTEPQVFAFVAVGTSAGMGILLLEFASHAHYVSYVSFALSLFFFGLALVAAHRFVRSLRQRVELVAVGSALEHRICWGTRTVRTQSFPASEIVAVAVLPIEGRNGRRVTLMGARHRVLGEVYQSRLLDPDATAPWFADMVALVAQRACASLALPSQRPRALQPSELPPPEAE